MRLIFELSKENFKGYKLPDLDVERVDIENIVGKDYVRKELNINAVPENEVVRHYINLSHKNYSVDTNFFPLGSCTMKYNPRINEEVANLKNLTEVHPVAPEEFIQGSLKLMFMLKELLKELGGFHDVCLHPAAGAHGELTGILLISAYHKDRGNVNKKKVLIPDSAHGTNPATASMGGFKVVPVKSNKKGQIDMDDFYKKLDDDTACLMITNPNTLGIFEENIVEIAEELHKRDALLYMDGANFNALIGLFQPGKWDVDVMHFNLHKTFSTPHGGGGPGSGPIGVSERLAPYLPVPSVEFDGEKYYLDWNRPKSVGKVISFYGHYGVFIKALAYILYYGRDLEKVAKYSVLNARLLKHMLKGVFKDPYPDSPCLHEFVLSAVNLLKYDIRAIDVAKRLLDYGFYAPTVYFPLIVREALMIEPTETETLQTIKSFAKALRNIVKEARENPGIVKGAPHKTPVRRIKEAEANRNLRVTFNDLFNKE